MDAPAESKGIMGTLAAILAIIAFGGWYTAWKSKQSQAYWIKRVCELLKENGALQDQVSILAVQVHAQKPLTQQDTKVHTAPKPMSSAALRRAIECENAKEIA